MAINLEAVSSQRETITREIRRESEVPRLGEADKKSESPDFAQALSGAFSKAAELEKAEDQAATRFANGEDVGLHEVIIGAEKASIAVRYAVTLKNKVIEAYRELMNTPV